MAGLVFSIFVLLLLIIVLSRISGHIPTTGRCIDAGGEVIYATITNENRVAEKPVKMLLKDDSGNKYFVKIKDSESKPWIKGDSVKIVFSEDRQNYRVLFNDYFRENEERMKIQVAERVKKEINPYFPAARFVGYQKENSEAFTGPGASSRTVFSFLTCMKRINSYMIISILLTILFLSWYSVAIPSLSETVFPFLAVITSYVIVYSNVSTSKRILTEISR